MKVPYNISPVQSDLVSAWYKQYFETSPFGCSRNYDPMKRQPIDKEKTDIYVTSFGNNLFIEYQIKTIKKFLIRPYNLIIVDNNGIENGGLSIELKQLCDDNKVRYLKAPNNHYQEPAHFDPTMKLGTTLSWLFHNVIKPCPPKYFFFLDQDSFLFRPFDPAEPLELRGIYGPVCENKPKWNIHVTCTGFKFDFVKDIPLDFRASWKHQLDTFGASYDMLFSKLDIEDYRLSHIGHRYFKHDIVSGIRPQHYEIIDNKWFHLVCSSHDQLQGEGAEKIIYAKGFLDRSLLE